MLIVEVIVLVEVTVVASDVVLLLAEDSSGTELLGTTTVETIVLVDVTVVASVVVVSIVVVSVEVVSVNVLSVVGTLTVE